MKSASLLVIAAASLPAVIVADMTEVRLLLESEDADCSGSNLVTYAFFGYAASYAYPASNASTDELPAFDMCTSGVKPTCSADGELTVSEYGSSACNGAATSTDVFSHDDSCVDGYYTVGCSQEDIDVENAYDTFEIVATLYNDDTCSTAAGGTLTIDDEEVEDYLEASMPESTSSSATIAALAEPIRGFADATDASSCIVEPESGNSTTSSMNVCVSGVYTKVFYYSEDCSGSPQFVAWLPGCLNTGTANTYAKISCEDSTLDIDHGALASIPSYLLASAAAVVIWGFLSSATGFF